MNLNELLAYLDQHAGALSAVFSAVVMLATVIYAILTALLVRETRRMREAQTEPRIEVTARPREEFVNIITLAIRNSGSGPAYDVSFHIRGETASPGELKLIADFTKSAFLLKGLKYLGAGQELRSSFTQITSDFEAKIQARLVVDVSYRSALQRTYKEQLCIDFSEFIGYGTIGKPHLYSIANSLEKLERDVGSLMTGFRRLRVDVFSAEDRRDEGKERDALIEEVRKTSPESDSQPGAPTDAPCPSGSVAAERRAPAPRKE